MIVFCVLFRDLCSNEVDLITYIKLIQVLETLNWLVLADILSNWSVKTCLELDFSYRLVSRQLIVNCISF